MGLEAIIYANNIGYDPYIGHLIRLNREAQQITQQAQQAAQQAALQASQQAAQQAAMQVAALQVAALQAAQQGEWVSPPQTPGEAVPVNPNTPYQLYVSNIPEAQEAISKAQEKLQDEYTEVYQEKNQALDALESDPESGVSSEIIQEIRNQTLTPKEFGELLKNMGTESNYLSVVGEVLAADFLAPSEDYEKIYTELLETGHQIKANKATVQDWVAEGQRHESEVKGIIENYNPQSANAEQYKAFIKAVRDEGKAHGQTIGKIISEGFAPVSDVDGYQMTAAEKSILDSADSAKSGRLNALKKTVIKECAIKNFARNLGAVATVASVAGTAVSINSDIKQYGAEWHNGWNNMSQEARNALIVDSIDGTIAAIDVVVACTLTPVAGLVVGTGFQAIGALIKAGYYKTQYGDDFNFGKNFLKLLNPFDDGEIILEHNPQSADMDTFLEGYVQETVLQGYVREVMLQGYVQETSRKAH